MDLTHTQAQLTLILREWCMQPNGQIPAYEGAFDDVNPPVHAWAAQELFQSDPHWQDLILFYEYFHGDNGRGCGVSHQTGRTALVAKLLQQSGEPFAVAESPWSSWRAAQPRPGRTGSL